MLEFLFPEFRLTWFDAGPSSPNKTGALLAILFVVAWWPSLRFRWGYWVSLPLAFVLSGLLLQTESRGALVGAGAAVVLLGAASGSVVRLAGLRLSVGRAKVEGISEIGRPARLRCDAANGRRCADPSTSSGLHKQRPYVLRIVVGACAVAALLLYAQQLGVNDRIAAVASGEDGSTNVRVALYSAGLQMIADAPFGWGHGQAGNAYGQWYQEIGDSRSYFSLVNSHLTWMADYGMLFQFGYISGWVLVLMVCWPWRGDATGVASLHEECSDGARATSHGQDEDAISMASLQQDGGSDVSLETSSRWNKDAIGVASLRLTTFAAWIVLGVCGIFSSVLTLLWLWCIPGSLLLLCLFQRIRSNDWSSVRQLQIAGLTVILSFFGLQAVAHAFAGENQIFVDHGSIEIGEVPKTVAIVKPDRKIVGDKYGHTIREYLEDTGGATVLRDGSAQVDLSTFEILVFSGSLPQMNLSEHSGNIVWLNPPANIDDATLQAFGEQTLTIVVGSLGDWRRVRLWQSLADENPKWNLIELRGVADFIPNWPRYIKEEEDE